jgi:tetratricopeptide (TPR) repeat protein
MRNFALTVLSIAGFIAAATSLLATLNEKQRRKYPLLGRHCPEKHVLVGIALCMWAVFFITGILHGWQFGSRPQTSLNVGPSAALLGRATTAFIESELAHADGHLAQLAESLFREGENAYADGRYPDAVHAYSQSVVAVPTISGFLNLAIAFYDLSDYTNSSGALQQSENLANKSNNNLMLADILNLQGSIAEKCGRYDDSERLSAQALQLSERNGIQLSKANALTNLGNIYSVKGKQDAALQYYKAAGTLYARLGDVIGEAQVIDNEGTVHAELKSFDEALRLQTDAAAKFRQANDLLGVGRALNDKGNTLASKGSSPDALVEYSEAKRIAEGLGNRLLLADTMINIADTLRLTEGANMADAEVSVRSAIAIYEKLLATDRLGTALTVLGNIQATAGEDDKALDNFARAAAMHRQSGNKLQAAISLGNMAEMYRTAKRFGIAEQVAQEAFRLFEEIGNGEGLANTYISLGNIRVETKRPGDAMKMYKRALVTAERDGDHRHKAMAMASIGEVRLSLFQFKQAERSLSSALNLYNSGADDVLSRAETEQSLGTLFLRTHRSCQATEMLQLSLADYRSRNIPDTNLGDLLRDIDKAKLACKA